MANKADYRTTIYLSEKTKKEASEILSKEGEDNLSFLIRRLISKEYNAIFQISSERMPAH